MPQRDRRKPGSTLIQTRSLAGDGRDFPSQLHKLGGGGISPVRQKACRTGRVFQGQGRIRGEYRNTFPRPQECWPGGIPVQTRSVSAHGDRCEHQVCFVSTDELEEKPLMYELCIVHEGIEKWKA